MTLVTSRHPRPVLSYGLRLLWKASLGHRCMSRAIQFHNHPFRFLLYLEWGLIAVAIVGILSAPPLREISRRGLPERAMFNQWPILTVGGLLLFGLLGLYLPTRGVGPRLGHIALQVALIVVASGLMLRGVRLFPFVYLQ